jgi:ABC-2 type transport system permease protein
VSFNRHGVLALYRFEMSRFRRTLWQSLATPVITTLLYFVVFGAAVGARLGEVHGVAYAAFIVPGLMLLAVFNESLNSAAFGIYLPRFTGTIYEVMSAPLSPLETGLGYIGAAMTKALLVSLTIFLTASLFVPFELRHPGWMLALLVLVALGFSLAGFLVGAWARTFEHLQVPATLVMTPLTFMGGAFYAIDQLPEPWRSLSLANPVVYFISAFRWSFFGRADVPLAASLALLAVFLLCGLVLVGRVLRQGVGFRH